MAFMTIRIDVRLKETDDQELRDASKAVSKTAAGSLERRAASQEEMAIIDRHSDCIADVARDRIEAICQELEALGYKVEADL